MHTPFVDKARHRVSGEVVALKKIRFDSGRDGIPVTCVREMRVGGQGGGWEGQGEGVGRMGDQARVARSSPAMRVGQCGGKGRGGAGLRGSRRGWHTYHCMREMKGV